MAVINDVVKDCTVWYAKEITEKGDKCNLCDENRRLSDTYDNGVVKINCDCLMSVIKYVTELSEIETIKTIKNSYMRDSSTVFVIREEYNIEHDYDIDNFSRERVGLIGQLSM